MFSLKLFNSVVVKKDAPKATDLRLGSTLRYGFILQPEVAALPEVGGIIDYCKDQFLTGDQMNQTFHKSWAKIQNSSRRELLAHQLTHYFTTYGLNSFGLYSDSTVYIPQEVLEVPNVNKLPLRVIKAVTEEELIQKCLDLLESGIALKEETIDDVLGLLDELHYQFDTVDNIKNKEAKLRIADKYDILPNNNTEFVRFLIYKATGRTLIINDRDTIQAIKNSGLVLYPYCEKYGMERLSQSFLRYKRIFLAFKDTNTYTNNVFSEKLKSLVDNKTSNSYIVNKLRKLAKKNHKPMPVDYLNNFTGMETFDKDELIVELNKVNNFRKIRLLYALHDRMQDCEGRLFKIRNGKTFIKEVTEQSDKNLQLKYNLVYQNLVESLNLKGTKVKLPKNLEYVLPTTEKQFVGNIPSGSYVDVKKDAIVGIYWEDDWGVYDYDLSSIALGSKVGWNSHYNNGGILYSGDITSAPQGATECLYAKSEINKPHLVYCNMFNGEEGSKFRFFVAQEEVRELNQDYTVDPNNILVQLETISEERQKVLGLFVPQEEGIRFVITNFNSGNSTVSGGGKIVEMTRDFLYKTNKDKISLRVLLEDAGCEFVTEEADIDLSVENLEKDTILNLFFTKEEPVIV